MPRAHPASVVGKNSLLWVLGSLVSQRRWVELRNGAGREEGMFPSGQSIGDDFFPFSSPQQEGGDITSGLRLQSLPAAAILKSCGSCIYLTKALPVQMSWTSVRSSVSSVLGTHNTKSC